MKLLISQSSQTSLHFLPLRSKYSPQHPVLKQPHPMFLPQCERLSFTILCLRYITESVAAGTHRACNGDGSGLNLHRSTVYSAINRVFPQSLLPPVIILIVTAYVT